MSVSFEAAAGTFNDWQPVDVRVLSEESCSTHHCHCPLLFCLSLSRTCRPAIICKLLGEDSEVPNWLARHSARVQHCRRCGSVAAGSNTHDRGHKGRRGFVRGTCRECCRAGSTTTTNHIILDLYSSSSTCNRDNQDAMLELVCFSSQLPLSSLGNLNQTCASWSSIPKAAIRDSQRNILRHRSWRDRSSCWVAGVSADRQAQTGDGRLATNRPVAKAAKSHPQLQGKKT